MAEIIFQIENGGEIRVSANAGDNLLEIARGANIAIDAPCSGNGACGKCRVKLLEGEVDGQKTSHISQEDYDDGWRLSCACRISAWFSGLKYCSMARCSDFSFGVRGT